MNARGSDRQYGPTGSGGGNGDDIGFTTLAVGILATSVVTAVPAGAITLAAVVV